MGILHFDHPDNYGKLAEFIHPRSAFSDFGDYILPVGFWGLAVLYGFLAKLVGVGSIAFVTPFLSVLAGWALFAIWKKIFTPKIAGWATFLYFIHPVVWYYSARGLLPNIPLVSFLILAVFFIFVQPFKSFFDNRKLNWIDDLLGSSMLCFALLIRPNEILWIGLAGLILFFSYLRKISFLRIVVWLIPVILSMVLYFYINNSIFGSVAGSYVVSRSLEVKSWLGFIFPFGINIKNILLSGYVYFAKMYWYLVLPALLGVVFYFKEYILSKKPISKDQKNYLWIFILVSLFLFIYYGSLRVVSFSLETIGIAYSRYWVPIHIMSLPFVVLGAIKMLSYSFLEKYKKYLVAVLVVLVSFFNFRAVFLGVDGLLAMQDNLNYLEEVRTDVLANTDPSAIIVTDREDKFFWPHRQVIVKFYNPRVGQAISDFVQQGWPIYYFSPTLEKQKLEETLDYLVKFDITISEFIKFGDHSLGKFIKLR